MVGEIHGTNEAPVMIDQMICTAIAKDLEVVIGLELPYQDQPTFDAYLQSDGALEDRDKIISLHFWGRDYQDGRASQTMLNLVENIRSRKKRGQSVDLILLDDPSSPDRDAEMATRVVQNYRDNPGKLFITLTGNIHNHISEGSGRMGEHVKNQLDADQVLSLNQTYSGGTAWVCLAGEPCGPVKLGGRGGVEINIEIDPAVPSSNYNGSFNMGEIHASHPAKDSKD